MIYAPRFPRPHREVLWGVGSAKDYEGLLIKPTKFVNENFIDDEDWDNIQRILVSLLTGESCPNQIIRKLCAKGYNSKTKKALWHYNQIVKSEFLLKFIHDPEFRRAILYALNRDEHHNALYRSITLNHGELRGKSEDGNLASLYEVNCCHHPLLRRLYSERSLFKSHNRRRKGIFNWFISHSQSAYQPSWQLSILHTAWHSVDGKIVARMGLAKRYWFCPKKVKEKEVKSRQEIKHGKSNYFLLKNSKEKTFKINDL